MKKQKDMQRVLVKVVNKIRKSNILFLLHVRWRRSVLVIQKNFRLARLIKKARIDMLIMFLDKIAKEVKIWNSSKINQKVDIAQRLLKDLVFNHARAMIKYKNDMKPTMNKFSRNMFFVDSNANSEFSGRNVNFSNLKKPRLTIFTQKKEILENLMFMEKTGKKSSFKTFKIVKKVISIRKK
jgi:hypothetical protein